MGSTPPGAGASSIWACSNGQRVLLDENFRLDRRRLGRFDRSPPRSRSQSPPGDSARRGRSQSPMGDPLSPEARLTGLHVLSPPRATKADWQTAPPVPRSPTGKPTATPLSPTHESSPARSSASVARSEPTGMTTLQEVLDLPTRVKRVGGGYADVPYSMDELAHVAAEELTRLYDESDYGPASPSSASVPIVPDDGRGIAALVDVLLQERRQWAEADDEAFRLTEEVAAANAEVQRLERLLTDSERRLAASEAETKRQLQSGASARSVAAEAEKELRGLRERLAACS